MSFANSFLISGQLARRFLTGHAREPLIRFIGRISMVGMAIAVAILILVLSVMNGFEREFTQRILGFVPHASLELVDSQKQDWESAAERMRSANGIAGVAPFVQLDGMLIRGSAVEPVLLSGQSPSEIERVFGRFLSQRIANPGERGVYLGHRLANSLAIEAGGSIRLLIADAKRQIDDSGPRSIGASRIETLTVLGTLDSGTELDRYLAVGLIEEVAKLKYGVDSHKTIDGFHLRVDDLFNSRTTAHAAAISSDVYGALTDWSAQYGNLYLAIQLSRQMVVFLLAAIVAIAAFNIFVTLGMSVRHRQNEIAILRTLGLRKHSVRATFALQGLFIFLPGFVCGALLGILLSLGVPNLVPVIEALFGVEFLNPSIYPIDYLPAEIKALDILLIFAVALLVSLVATLVPAWRASNLDPASILK